MPAFLQDLPVWALKAGAVFLTLILVGLIGLLLARFFRKLTRNLPLD